MKNRARLIQENPGKPERGNIRHIRSTSRRQYGTGEKGGKRHDKGIVAENTDPDFVILLTNRRRQQAKTAHRYRDQPGQLFKHFFSAHGKSTQNQNHADDQQEAIQGIFRSVMVGIIHDASSLLVSCGRVGVTYPLH
jgi:hypothetical protein